MAHHASRLPKDKQRLNLPGESSHGAQLDTSPGALAECAVRKIVLLAPDNFSRHGAPCAQRPEAPQNIQFFPTPQAAVLRCTRQTLPPDPGNSPPLFA